ncbi:MAG TPA: class I SAM-dependent methyltransferase, partial [Bacteroidia bacterium]|nr:class I SAM-dependent methyltransferase [Bacteroidia bacterium]
MQLSLRQWKAFSYNKNKSDQENAGFSHRIEVQNAIDKLKSDFCAFLDGNIQQNSEILDFGCGPGVYLSMLYGKYKISGIDVSQAMINKAKSNLPDGNFYCGNFLTYCFPKKYKLIYSISALEYIPVSQLKSFFEKCYNLLNKGGYIFIQYPHALSLK